MNEADALALVTRVPRTTAEIYRDLHGLEPGARMSVSHRNARRRLGQLLEKLHREGKINRGIIEGEGHRPWVCFWTLDAGDSPAHPA